MIMSDPYFGKEAVLMCKRQDVYAACVRTTKDCRSIFSLPPVIAELASVKQEINIQSCDLTTTGLETTSKC